MKPSNASTGPRSPEGKARSSMNALKSGIYSKSEIIPGEDPARLTTLTEEYFQRFQPAVPEQRDLVDILVRSTWTLRRLATAEAQVWTYSRDARFELDDTSPLGHAFNFCDKTLTRLQRMVNSTQRNFRDALRDLERLRAPLLDVQATPDPAPGPVPAARQTQEPVEKEPVNQSNQFVPSTSAQPTPVAPKPAPKSPEEPLPFHRPGTLCLGEHIDREKYKRCPLCYPSERLQKTQE
jgi:hypothetical protein